MLLINSLLCWIIDLVWICFVSAAGKGGLLPVHWELLWQQVAGSQQQLWNLKTRQHEINYEPV